LGNVMFDRERPELRAILDWEIEINRLSRRL
jgi:hypothetical protein